MLLILCSTALGGPWVRDAGQAYIKAGYGRFEATDFIQPDDVELEDASFDSDRASVYGEVGVGQQFQVVFDAPVVRARNTVADMPFSTTQLGDLRLGLEWGGNWDDTPVSFQALAKIPLYADAQKGDDRAAYPQVGDGQIDLNALFAVGRGWSVGPVRGWVASEFGYRIRTEVFLGDSNPTRRFADGVPFNLQVGWSPTVSERDLGWLFVSASGIKNLAVEESTQEFAQVELGGAIRVAKGLAVEGNASRILWARNTNRGSGFGVGVSWSR